MGASPPTGGRRRVYGQDSFLCRPIASCRCLNRRLAVLLHAATHLPVVVPDHSISGISSFPPRRRKLRPGKAESQSLLFFLSWCWFYVDRDQGNYRNGPDLR